MKKVIEKVKILFGVMVLAACLFVQQSAHASCFDTFTTTNSLYYGNKNVNYNGDGERVSFILQDNSIVRLYSRDGKHDYLSFASYYGYQNVDVSVKKLQHRDPKKIFFEINMFAGAHAKNGGYWIIGKYGDKWVSFVSLDSLAAVGYNVNSWHRLNSAVNDKGELILTASHDNGSIDFQAKIYWDKSAQWFGIARIR
ncbi:hypothetical protein [Phascolarctobacterium succinatutens]